MLDGAEFWNLTAHAGPAAIRSFNADVQAASMARSAKSAVQIELTATSPLTEPRPKSPTRISLEVPGSLWLAALAASPCVHAPPVVMFFQCIR